MLAMYAGRYSLPGHCFFLFGPRDTGKTTWLSVPNAGGQLYYWRRPSSSEVDFAWARGGRAIGVEVKAAAQWPHVEGILRASKFRHGSCSAGCLNPVDLPRQKP
jgi:predicted AAA+ superfamily ATPase